MWFGALLLLALGIFIVWDSHRLRSKKPERLSRATMEHGYRPGRLNKAWLYLGLGGMLAVLAFMEWMKPSLPPHTGRWSWFYGFLHEVLGEQRLFIYWAVFAVCCVVYGVFRWRRDRRGRPGLE